MATVWPERIKQANLYYEKWATKYKVAQLEKYYEGFHWQGDTDRIPYFLNLFYATVDIKLATYTFDRIYMNLKPRPAHSDMNLEMAAQIAQIKEDALNTLVSNPNAKFKEECEQAFQDSFFRFGLLEVGYSADWIDNPRAGKPLYSTDVDPNAGPEAEIIREPDTIPQNETIYFKRIDPARFRVGGVEGRYLESCNWCGYYDFYYAEDIKKAPGLVGTEEVQTVSGRTADFDSSEEFDSLLRKGDLVKIWTIYDLRAKKRFFWDESNDVILKTDEYTRLPFSDLRWAKPRTGWYPIPPAWNWVPAQDEINQSREDMRDYRSRFKSQFQVAEGQIEEDELQKFEEGKNGGIIKVQRESAIQPIQNPTLSGVVADTMVVGKDDFVLMAGSSSEAFGVADRMTATQSMEISKRTSIRENRERGKISNWLVSVGRETLKLAIEKMNLGFWAKTQVDPGEQLLGVVQANQFAWQYILGEDLNDGVDYDISVDITTLSPIANEDDKRKFLEFLALTSQYPQIAMSPVLIREAAYRVGYRNERIIKEMQSMAILVSLGQMTGNLQGQEGNQTSQQIVANQTPNDSEQIRNQMEGQLV